jgi:hypothetical protein
MILSVLVMALLPLGAATNIAANPAAKWAIVQLNQPTLIGESFAMGPVIFEHDDARMARGEPCTIVYRYEAGKGVGEQLASFHCKPRWGSTAPDRFSMVTGNDGFGHCVLREYQFAGDTEAHGVPIRANR